MRLPKTLSSITTIWEAITWLVIIFALSMLMTTPSSGTIQMTIVLLAIGVPFALYRVKSIGEALGWIALLAGVIALMVAPASVGPSSRVILFELLIGVMYAIAERKHFQFLRGLKERPQVESPLWQAITCSLFLVASTIWVYLRHENPFSVTAVLLLFAVMRILLFIFNSGEFAWKP